jgi:hypothetical protein
MKLTTRDLKSWRTAAEAVQAKRGPFGEVQLVKPTSQRREDLLAQRVKAGDLVMLDDEAPSSPTGRVVGRDARGLVVVIEAAQVLEWLDEQ